MFPKVRAPLPQVIDSTIRAEYVTCQTKGYYSFQRKLGGVYESTDLIAGGAFARGLEIFRLKFYGEKLEYGEALKAGILAAIVAYGKHVPAPGKENKGLDRVCLAIQAYLEHYPPATDHIQPYFTGDKPAVEFSFAIPLPVLHPESKEPFIYAGRFDMVGIRQQQLVGLDEKTTSQLGPTWVNKWNLRGQFTGYCWSLHQMNFPVIGMLVRGVSFLKNNFGFAEVLQMRSKWQMDQWYEQLVADVKSMVVAWENNWYNQNFHEACAEFSGCPFQRLCLAAEPEDWIAGHYGIREWDPLKKNPVIQAEDKPVEYVEAPDELRALMERK